MHWTRAYSASSERARARASAVLPTPGESSISTWPSASRATTTSRTTWSGAFTAREMFSLNRDPSSATSIGSSLGAVAIAPWYARPYLTDWAGAGRGTQTAMAEEGERIGVEDARREIAAGDATAGGRSL